MYISSFLSLQTALSGVEAAQEELATTGTNISNENNPDYERQTVTLSARPGVTIASGGNNVQLGTGVDATAVTNVADPYLDTAYRNQNAVASGASTLQSYTAQLQDLLGENNNNSGAISSQLSAYWSDWTSLSDNPNNAGAQAAVVNAGQSLASTINNLATNISSLQAQAQAQYQNLTQGSPGGQVYDDAQQLASLNAAIKQATADGTTDNQLLDKRNAVIDDLSGLATTTVTPAGDGTVNVTFGGVDLLSQSTPPNTSVVSPWPTSNPLTLAQGTTALSFPSSSPGSGLTAAQSVGGTLGALLAFAGTGGTLDQVTTQLNEVAQNLAGSVNTLTQNSTSGVTQFFTATGTSSSITAANIAVNPLLVSSPSKVPVSSTGTSGSNDIAVAVAQLSNTPAIGYQQTPSEAYAALVETIGGITQSAASNDTNQSTLLTQIQNQKLSVEGVDNNEEMANLVAEQQAYQASAKVMNAFSTMMNSLMTVVGQ